MRSKLVRLRRMYSISVGGWRSISERTRGSSTATAGSSASVWRELKCAYYHAGSVDKVEQLER